MFYYNKTSVNSYQRNWFEKFRQGRSGPGGEEGRKGVSLGDGGREEVDQGKGCPQGVLFIIELDAGKQNELSAIIDLIRLLTIDQPLDVHRRIIG